MLGLEEGETPAPKKRNPIMIILGGLALLAIAVVIVMGWDTIRTMTKALFS